MKNKKQDAQSQSDSLKMSDLMYARNIGEAIQPEVTLADGSRHIISNGEAFKTLDGTIIQALALKGEMMMYDPDKRSVRIYSAYSRQGIERFPVKDGVVSERVIFNAYNDQERRKSLAYTKPKQGAEAYQADLRRYCEEATKRALDKKDGLDYHRKYESWSKKGANK